MILVDTSVWIEVFRKPARFSLESAVAFDEVVVTAERDAQDEIRRIGNELCLPHADFIGARRGYHVHPAVLKLLA